MTSPPQTGKNAYLLAFKSVAQLPIHPFLIAIYPVLALLQTNIQEIRLQDSLRSFFFLLILGGLLYGALAAIIRRPHTAALIASILLILLLSYGHIYSIFKSLTLGSEILGRHRYLLPLFAGIGISVTYFILRGHTSHRQFTATANIISIIMISIPLLSIIRQAALYTSHWDLQRLGLQSGDWDPDQFNAQEMPDIYYIILDAYGRSDHLLDRFGYDNAEFIDALSSKGFFIADKSNTNYFYTSISLATSLNMQYVEDIGVDLTFGNYPTAFVEPIRESLVRSLLERIGYQIVATRSGYIPTEIVDADFYLGYGVDEPDMARNPLTLNAFESMLLRSTAGLVLWDMGGNQVRNWVFLATSHPFDEKREIILSQFRDMDLISSIPGPKFVFMHIIAPHPPFVFDEYGNKVAQEGAYTLSDDDKASGYPEQAKFISDRMEEAVETILKNSSTPPVIIIQGDHGPLIGPGKFSADGEKAIRRAAILNTYYLPTQCKDRLYPEITPVNSFRLIFNCLFGMPVTLLDDKVYFSPSPKKYPYDFQLMAEGIHSIP
jgi:hypothetical protein